MSISSTVSFTSDIICFMVADYSYFFFRALKFKISSSDGISMELPSVQGFLIFA